MFSYKIKYEEAVDGIIVSVSKCRIVKTYKLEVTSRGQSTISSIAGSVDTAFCASIYSPFDTIV